MILIKSQGPLRPIKIKYMTEEGIKVSARPILVLTCFFYSIFKKKGIWLFERTQNSRYFLHTPRKSLFGDKAPCHSSVKNWFDKFNCRRRSLKDEVREGRPKTAVASDNIYAVRELIMQDCHVTYREIQLSLGISATNIQSILHEQIFSR